MKALKCTLAACSLTLLLAAEPNIRSDEFRKQFIDNFRRTGLNTTPGDAMMLRILVAGARARNGVEIGSATGFGALNMGIAFERNGGRLQTLEIDPRRAEETRQHLKAVGLDRVVSVVEGDALKTLPGIAGPIDFVFIDAVKQDYKKYLELIEPKLKPGAVVVADNVIAYEKQMADYLEYVTTNPNYETVIIRSSLEKNDGMSVSYRIR